CDLPLSWRKGRDNALLILTTSQLNPAHYSYAELFTATSGIDMLCPFGQNKYLGISGTDDELDDPSQVPRPPPPITTSPTSQELQGENDDEEIMLTFQEALVDNSPTDAPPAQSNQPHTLDSLSPPLPQGPGIRPDNYLLYSRRWIHKQTVCCLVVNKDFVSKSLNRLECVHAGYTKVNKRIDMSAGRITKQNLFLVRDIFLTILHSAWTLSIGILHSTTATLSGISCSSINIGMMKASRTTVKITSQLLSIISTRPLPDISQVFLWDGGYITACSVIQGSSQSTERVVVVTVPGSLVEPVNPKPTFIRLCNNINVDEFLQVNGGQSTWQISRDALQAACDLLWAKAVEINLPLKSIAVVTPLDETKFPYRHSDGKCFVFHIFQEHEEYVVPGQREIGVPLPASIWKEMRLTDLEQTASRIPKTHWQPSYIPLGEIGKENVPLLVSRGSKCAGAQAGPSCPSEKAQMTVETAVSILSA
ncbi:hypothetical protein DFJ58DRAFT_655715, partial [Suillus subalutaceus]|uniref:uncharacterized protein n=1 Tax=Suillus subalutaceus TaxID=48586 RepID=UPI001B8720F3